MFGINPWCWANIRYHRKNIYKKNKYPEASHEFTQLTRNGTPIPASDFAIGGHNMVIFASKEGFAGQLH